MEESLKYVKREYYPSINGRVGYTHRNTNYLVNNGMNFSASLDFPSVNIMNTKNKIDEAKAQLDVALDNVNLSKQNIYFEVQNAYVNMQQIEKRIPLFSHSSSMPFSLYCSYTPHHVRIRLYRFLASQLIN